MSKSTGPRHPIMTAALKLFTGVFALGVVWKAVPELRRYMQLRRM